MESGHRLLALSPRSLLRQEDNPPWEGSQRVMTGVKALDKSLERIYI
jgi:hypothetical protein